MLGDIAAEFIGGVGRFLARVFIEIVVETVIEGSGRFLWRVFRPRAQPGDAACILTGLLFWAALIMVGFWLYGRLSVTT